MADPEQTPLLVIGAGPYGLATAAEAERLGVPPVVLGEPMGFWRANMPAAMLLRSGRDWHLDASGEHTLDAYAEAEGLDPDALDPIPIDVFIGYADWFTAQKGIEPRPERVRALARRDGGGFEARMEDGSTILADRSSPRRASRTSPSSRRLCATRSRPASGRTPPARWSSRVSRAAAA